ncbi:MAG: hypothetical protein ACKVOQ_04945 [Cyclobacteriaceae bacterium]
MKKGNEVYESGGGDFYLACGEVPPGLRYKPSPRAQTNPSLTTLY